MKYTLPSFYLFITILLLSCTDQKPVSSDTGTYFGGEIINPNSKFILLFKNDKLIDSIPLNEKNQFKYQFKNFESGLYTFRHDEFQYLYLEEQDSLFLRLNTIEFDETLTFSGIGANRNNLLIKTFLKNETDSENIKQHFETNPEEFSKTINTRLESSLNELNKHADKHLFSKEFLKVANTHITYHNYGLKEKFALQYCKTHDQKLADSYFDYRKNIDYNINATSNFYPYFNYMNLLIEQVTHANHSCKNTITTYISKLKVIDSITQNVDLKNQLIHKTAFSFLNKQRSGENVDLYLSALKEYHADKKTIDKFSELSRRLKTLTRGTVLPNFEVINKQHKTQSINELITQPSVIYFWSKKYPRHLRSGHKKVAKYAENSKFKFIAICLDDDMEIWEKIIENYKNSNEYMSTNLADLSEKLMINNINKIIVVDKYGKILNTKMNFFDPKFESKLLELQP